MTEHLRKLGAYNKAIAAALGSGAATLTALLGLTDVLPESLAGWLTAAAAALTTVSVFMVRNHVLIDQVGDRTADLLED